MNWDGGARSEAVSGRQAVLGRRIRLLVGRDYRIQRGGGVVAVFILQAGVLGLCGGEVVGDGSIGGAGQFDDLPAGEAAPVHQCPLRIRCRVPSSDCHRSILPPVVVPIGVRWSPEVELKAVHTVHNNTGLRAFRSAE